VFTSSKASVKNK